MPKSSLPELVMQIRAYVMEARSAAARTTNFIQVWTNYHIGRLIVEDEQRGKKRAGYAEGTLQSISKKLAKEFGRGFTDRNLRFFRQFYLTYKNRPIWKSVISKSGRISQTSKRKKAFCSRPGKSA